MQYRDGNVSVENGEPVVTGDITEWLTNASAGDLLVIQGENVTYEIASVDSDTQITLSSYYSGSTGTKPYVISRSFTAVLGIPYPEPGDVETLTILKKTVLKIEQLIADHEERITVLEP